MSEERIEHPQAQGVTPPSSLDWKQPDWFLQVLINITNSGDGNIEIGMTLLVSGFLVSGKLVGGARYFEGFGSDFASAFSEPEVAADIRRSFAQYGDLYKKDEAQQDASASPPTYIHLKEARFFNTAGNPIPGNRGVWWRGRLSSVSGFMIGTLQPA